MAKFFSNLKICKQFNFDWNQNNLSIQHKYMYMYQEKIRKIENSLLFNFGIIWLGHWSLTQSLSNLKNS